MTNPRDPRPPDLPPPMLLALEASFGSLGRWRERLATLTRDGRAGRIGMRFDVDSAMLVLDHETGHGVALLELEPVSGALADAAIAAIDWPAVYARYQAAVRDASEPFAAHADALDGRLLIDARRAAVHAAATTRLPGAQWRDPAKVAHWVGALPRDRGVVVYCVYGHEVGRSTALRLRAAGIDALFLGGGIDGWQAEGRPVEAKPPAP